ncbi:unnamed protein product, partial [Adineta steineri]
FYLKSRLTSVLFSSHSITNLEEEQEKNGETETKEIENDEVWSQFKRKSTKESSDRSSFKLNSKKKRKSVSFE